MDRIESLFLPYWVKFNTAFGNKYKYVVTSRYREPKPDRAPSYHNKVGMAMDIIFKTLEGGYAPLEVYEDFFLYLYAEGFPGGVGIDNTVSNGNVHIHLDARNYDNKARYFFVEDDGKHEKPMTTRAELVAHRVGRNASIVADIAKKK